MTTISFISIGDRTESYSLRLLKALVESKGHTAHLIYLNIRELNTKLEWTGSLSSQLRYVTRTSGIVAISVFTYNFDLACKVTEYLRNHNHPLIIWGGPHAIAAPEYCSEYADIVVTNEGEEAILKILELFQTHGKHFSESAIPNIAYRDGNQFVKNPIEKLPFSLNDIPLQDYTFKNWWHVNADNNLVPMKYDGKPFDYITMFSRGCPHRCSFCLNSNPHSIRYYAGRSVDNMIAELAEVKEKYGGAIREVVFYDDDFFALPLSTLHNFADKYRKYIGIPIHAVNVSATSFREDKLLVMQQAGVKGIIVGIQSISENGKQTYRNPATKDNIRYICEVMERHPGMELIFHIIYGNPYENEDDIAENILFLNSLPKVYSLSNYQLVIYPGTELWERVKNDPTYSYRATEGYTTPYYYRKPGLELWNYLTETYLCQKKDLPAWIVQALVEKQYWLLRVMILPMTRHYGKLLKSHLF